MTQTRSAAQRGVTVTHDVASRPTSCDDDAQSHSRLPCRAEQNGRGRRPAGRFVANYRVEAIIAADPFSSSAYCSYATRLRRISELRSMHAVVRFRSFFITLRSHHDMSCAIHRQRSAIRDGPVLSSVVRSFALSSAVLDISACFLINCRINNSFTLILFCS